MLRVLACLSVALLVLGWAGIHTYGDRELRYRHQVESAIRNTNDLALKQVMEWRMHTIATADALTEDRFFAQAVAQWFAHPTPNLQDDLEQRLHSLTERSGFAKILLLDKDGKVRMATHRNALPGEMTAREHAALQHAMQEAQVAVIEPHEQVGAAPPNLFVIAPIYDGLTPLGAVWMVVDLRERLFPLLNIARQNSATTESLLLMAKGGAVQAINPLRHRPPSPSQTLPAMDGPTGVVQQALEGARGLLYGPDYRQHPVLAASGVVPGSPWLLLTKMDVAEAFADNERKEGLFLVLLVGLAVLLMLSAVMYGMWFTAKRERSLKRALVRNMKQLERAQKAAQLGFFSVDFATRDIELSGMAAEILGLPNQQHLSFEEAKSYLSAPEIRNVITQIKRARKTLQAQKIDFSLSRAGAPEQMLECWCEVDATAKDQGTQRMVGTLQDITLRKQLDRTLGEYRALLEQQVRKDSLTNVGNRRALDEALHREWQLALREQQPLSMLMIDIDHFKAYNDLYGHVQGDVCLQRVAHTVDTHLPRARDQIFRFGGEEFAVLLPNTKVHQAQYVAHQLCLAVQAQHIAHAASPTGNVVTVSIGAACWTPQQGEAFADLPLTTMADQALYEAKRNGRNQAQSYNNLETPSEQVHIEPPLA